MFNCHIHELFWVISIFVAFLDINNPAFCKINSSGKTLDTRQKIFYAALPTPCIGVLQYISNALANASLSRSRIQMREVRQGNPVLDSACLQEVPRHLACVGWLTIRWHLFWNTKNHKPTPQHIHQPLTGGCCLCKIVNGWPSRVSVHNHLICGPV